MGKKPSRRGLIIIFWLEREDLVAGSSYAAPLTGRLAAGLHRLFLPIRSALAGFKPLLIIRFWSGERI